MKLDELIKLRPATVLHLTREAIAFLGIPGTIDKQVQFWRRIQCLAHSFQGINESDFSLFVESEAQPSQPFEEFFWRRSGEKRMLTMSTAVTIFESNRPLPHLARWYVVGVDDDVLVGPLGHLLVERSKSSSVLERQPVGDAVKNLESALVGNRVETVLSIIYLDFAGTESMFPPEDLDEEIPEVMFRKMESDIVHVLTIESRHLDGRVAYPAIVPAPRWNCNRTRPQDDTHGSRK